MATREIPLKMPLAPTSRTTLFPRIRRENGFKMNQMMLLTATAAISAPADGLYNALFLSVLISTVVHCIVTGFSNVDTSIVDCITLVICVPNPPRLIPLGPGPFSPG